MTKQHYQALARLETAELIPVTRSCLALAFGLARFGLGRLGLASTGVGVSLTVQGYNSGWIGFAVTAAH